nr:hypothetical protein [Leifsonia sp. Leaf325]
MTLENLRTPVSGMTGPRPTYGWVASASLWVAASGYAVVIVGALLGGAMNLAEARELQDLRTIFGWLGVLIGTGCALTAVVTAVVALSHSGLTRRLRVRAVVGLSASVIFLALWGVIFSAVFALVLYPDYYL